MHLRSLAMKYKVSKIQYLPFQLLRTSLTRRLGISSSLSSLAAQSSASSYSAGSSTWSGLRISWRSFQIHWASLLRPPWSGTPGGSEGKPKECQTTTWQGGDERGLKGNQKISSRNGGCDIHPHPQWHHGDPYTDPLVISIVRFWRKAAHDGGHCFCQWRGDWGYGSWRRRWETASMSSDGGLGSSLLISQWAKSL